MVHASAHMINRNDNQQSEKKAVGLSFKTRNAVIHLEPTCTRTRTRTEPTNTPQNGTDPNRCYWSTGRVRVLVRVLYILQPCPAAIVQYAILTRQSTFLPPLQPPFAKRVCMHQHQLKIRITRQYHTWYEFIPRVRTCTTCTYVYTRQCTVRMMIRPPSWHKS